MSLHNGGPLVHQALATIFDPLVRGEQAADRPGSLGLGLYIARVIVAGHGGTIHVTSSKEAGTTFTVHLPRRHAYAEFEQAPGAALLERSRP